MKRTKVRAIYADPNTFADKEITLGGWVKTIRASNAFGFIELNDGSLFWQSSNRFGREQTS